MLPNAASALFDVVMHIIVYIKDNYKIVHLLPIPSLKKTNQNKTQYVKYLFGSSQSRSSSEKNSSKSFLNNWQ